MSPVVKARSTGFTLIELLVVVFIIGILIAATLTIVPKVKRAVYGAQTSAQLSALSNAIQQYYNDYKAYPGPLPNSQLYSAADSGPLPSIPDPSSSTNPYLTLTGQTTPFATATPYDPTNLNPGYITGAQNLVLGLLGGLELTNTTGYAFVYNPADIFAYSAGNLIPSPRGGASLNYANPKRQQAYIQVKQGDISVPNSTYNGNAGGGVVDEAMRGAYPKDAMIPVFLDKYSSPMPILYYRTNVGGTAIAGFRNGAVYVDDSGTTLSDASLSGFGTPPNEIAQYDLDDNLVYTKSAIGTQTNSPNNFHGLEGVGTSSSFVDVIDSNQGAPSNNGKNSVAYFKDPTLNPVYNSATTGTQPSNVHLGVARQKDSYLLISAGPDRLYGTRDDNIFPGPLLP